MVEDLALVYTLAGLFQIIFALPVLLFWRRTKWMTAGAVIAFLLAAALCWLFVLLGSPQDRASTPLFTITILPALAAAAFAASMELVLRRRRKAERRRMRRRRAVRDPHSTL